jgi:hypothetical protein
VENEVRTYTSKFAVSLLVELQEKIFDFSEFTVGSVAGFLVKLILLAHILQMELVTIWISL